MVMQHPGCLQISLDRAYALVKLRMIHRRTAREVKENQKQNGFPNKAILLQYIFLFNSITHFVHMIVKERSHGQIIYSCCKCGLLVTRILHQFLSFCNILYVNVKLYCFTTYMFFYSHVENKQTVYNAIASIDLILQIFQNTKNFSNVIRINKTIDILQQVLLCWVGLVILINVFSEKQNFTNCLKASKRHLPRLDQI